MIHINDIYHGMIVSYFLAKIIMICRRWCKKIAENFNLLGRAQQRHRRQTDGRLMP